jgi:hypothetical protein
MYVYMPKKRANQNKRLKTRDQNVIAYFVQQGGDIKEGKAPLGWLCYARERQVMYMLGG